MGARAGDLVELTLGLLVTAWEARRGLADTLAACSTRTFALEVLFWLLSMAVWARWGERGMMGELTCWC